MKTIIIFMIMAIAGTSFGLEAQWGASERATGYELFYNPVGFEGEKAFINVGNVLTYDLTTLENVIPGTNYELTIKAFNEAGKSADSNAVSTVLLPAYESIDNLPPPVELTIPAPVTIIINVQ